MALIHLLDAGSKFVKKENVISEKCNKAKHNKKKRYASICIVPFILIGLIYFLIIIIII